MGVCTCVCVYVSMCVQVSAEVRRRCQISCSWSYRLLGRPDVVLGSERFTFDLNVYPNMFMHILMSEQQALKTAEQSHQSHAFQSFFMVSTCNY